MSRILVTDGDQRAALAVVRSLGRHGDDVFVCSDSGRSVAGASRFCVGEDALGVSSADPEASVEAVRKIVGRRAVDLVIPIAEGSLRALLPARDRLHPAEMPFPSERAFELVSDKERLLEVAADLGIAVPRQRVAGSRADVEKIVRAMAPCEFPVAVKSAQSVTEIADSLVHTPGVRYASDLHELAAILLRSGPEAFPLLVQDRIAGPGTGVFLLLWGGKLRAQFIHRRIREKPPSGGVSVCREPASPDDNLVERSRRLLEWIGWDGVAMVEYKIDQRTGTPVLMEVNGRFWGSLQLAVDAGVDFPAVLVDAYRGRPVEPPCARWLPVRSRWLWGEADHLWARLRGPRGNEPPLEHPVLDRLRAAGQVLHWRRHDRTEVLRPDDPKPFFRETWNRVRPLLRHRTGGNHRAGAGRFPDQDREEKPTPSRTPS